MARLQRKKTSSPKKKRPSETAGSESNGPTDATDPPARTAPPVVKKVALPPRLKPRETAEPGKIRGAYDQAVQFLREVKVELKKVAWPSRKQTIGSTVVVLVLVFIISAFLGLVDMGLAGLVRLVLQ
jgi:preprotein translocase subunit SecE